MLILSRKVNEKIVIGSDISVSIIDIRGDQVRLGISAPRQVEVFREEVLRQIEAENKAAALAATADAAAKLPKLLPKVSQNDSPKDSKDK
jgi:carbon storage regulator